MSNRIHELINNIRDKAISLHEQLSSERTLNQKLQEEVKTLKEQISMKDNEMEKLKAKNVELETTGRATNEQNITHSEAKVVSNEQIDELVREINYCIEQLKK